jgi:hypothetical protein
MVDRSGVENSNGHLGRLFIQKERSTKTIKVTTVDDKWVPKEHGRLPPESNAEIKEVVVATLQDGSIGCGDGGRAIASSVRAAADGAVPLAYAVHGRKPTKQFTRLCLIAKSTVSPALQVVLRKQGRWCEKSAHIRTTGGNQAAESEWGCRNMNLKARHVHSGQAKKHAHAHALCSMHLCHKVGMAHVGAAWKSWLEHFVDKGAPGHMLSQSGWTGLGASDEDKDVSRIVSGGGTLDDLGPEGKKCQSQEEGQKCSPTKKVRKAEGAESKRARMQRALEARRKAVKDKPSRGLRKKRTSKEVHQKQRSEGGSVQGEEA